MTDVTSRWRWVVLAASFCSILMTGYAQYHVGVMKMALMRHLDSDVSLNTWLMSYYASSFALYAPVGSVMINLTSCRTCVVASGLVCLLGFVLSSLVTHLPYLFLTLTLLGIGQGMCTAGAIVILGYYFPKQAGMASGVSISGGALGTFMHPPLLQGLVEGYGLQGALLLSGAIAFQGSVFGALMRPSSGLTPTEASFAVSATGLGSFISRLATGFLSQDPRVGHVLLYCGLNGVDGLLSLAAPSLIALGIVGSYAYSFMMGLYTGGVFTLYLPILQDIVGLHHCSTALGLTLFILGVGGIVGAPLTNLVHETNSHPYVMYGFVGALFCTAAVLGSLLTTVIPPAQPSTGQHKPSSLPPAHHHPHHPEEETQLHEKQISITEKPTKLSSQRILENDRNTADFHLAKITYRSEDKRDKTLPEVTRPLLSRVAETQTPV